MAVKPLRVSVHTEPIVIDVNDYTSPTEVVIQEPLYVQVEGGDVPVVNVHLGGGRGPIWLPGNTYDPTSLAAILTGLITKTQLSVDLVEEIDLSTTGLLQARTDLDAAIQSNIDNGTLLDATVTRMDQAEDAITLAASRLSAAEGNISNAQVFIDDATVRISVAEQSVENHENFIVTQESILKNEWTVKIQENQDGTAVAAGVGLLVYPAWNEGQIYEEDDFLWYEEFVYKSKLAHTSTTENAPPNVTYWALVPYATKSQFGVLAETFFVQTGLGNKAIPFLIQGDQVYINGDMIVNGLIQAGALSANQVFTWSVQSQNYFPGVAGYKLDAVSGYAELNNMTLTINYGDIVGRPNDEDIYNSYVSLANYVTTTTLNQNIAAIQAQLDSNFTTWYYPGVPTLSNEPAVNWNDDPTKDLHIGDLYYNESTGTVYRFKYDDVEEEYLWFEMPNTELSEALALAANAQDTADNKRRTFVAQPFGPYDVGDLWVDGSIIKYAVAQRDAGYQANEWVNTASLGAPIGTLVAGVPASDIATATTNFNSSNDRNSTAIVVPTLTTDGTCVDHTIRSNASADISFEWGWSGNEGDIDGFQVLVYQINTAGAYTIGTTPSNETVYTIPANKRVFILYGVQPNLYYTFAVRAYRAVDKDINASGIIVSTWVKPTITGENPYRPSSSVAFSGNITGTINGIPAANVNVWSSITGDGKPADGATKNNIYNQTSEPTGGTYTTGDLWIDTDSNPTTIAQWNGTAWVLVASYVNTTSQLTDDAGLGTTATWNGVTGTGKPADNATRNVVTYSATAPAAPVNGAIWVDTSTNPYTAKVRVAGAWQIASNYTSNTNQLTDGAGLGTTAIWEYISGTGKPEDNATNTQNDLDAGLETVTGGIIVKDVTEQQLAHLTGGDITFYDYYNGAYNQYKSLKKIVHGECTDGVEVNLGYFRNPPKIHISSKNLEAYKQLYYAQDQKLIVEASTPERRSNNYYFTPQCKLLLVGRDGVIGGTSNTIFELVSSADQIISDGVLYYIAVKTVYTSELTFPINTKSITLHGYTKSQWAWLYFNEAYIDVGRVDTLIVLQVRISGVWYDVLSYNYSNNPITLTTNNASFIYNNSSDIERARLKIVYTGYSRYYNRVSNILGLNSAYGPESVDTHHYGIYNCTYILSNATLSYQAKANYMAIGD